MDTQNRTFTLAAAGVSTERQPRILVIEDDRHVRSLLCDLLDHWGYEYQAVANGRDGLAMFDRGLYDVVLTDLAMPEVSGLDVAAAVRRRDAAVAVVMLTASMQSLDSEGRRLGFRVLRKPLDIENLLRTLRDALARPSPV